MQGTKMNSIWTVVLAMTLFNSVAAEVAFFPTPPRSSDPNITVEHLVFSTERQALIKAVLATVASPLGFVHTLPPTPSGCTEMVKVSNSASAAGCKYATNGGTFNMQTGACIGSLVANGTIVQVDDSGYASFGLTADGRWAFGDVTSDVVTSEGVVELLSGFKGGLLVENSQGVPSTNSQVAQRTAVGIDAQGRFLILTIDGSESPPRGTNITELGNLFASVGATTALNLDGGGSTTAWEDGELVDRPTCADTPMPECERGVASFVCVMPGAAA